MDSALIDKKCSNCGQRNAWRVISTRPRKRTQDVRRIIICRACGNQSEDVAARQMPNWR